MARYDEAHKERARDLILRNAADRFRREGIAAVGVRPLMADAGLTHGGFYSHFRSRADLVGAAVEKAAQSTLGYLEAAVADALPGQAFDALVASYLGERHIVEMSRGCAASALAPEIAREDIGARDRFMAQNDRIIGLIARTLPQGGTPDARMLRATSIFAGMMGALQLARITSDGGRAARILRSGAETAHTLANQPWD